MVGRPPLRIQLTVIIWRPNPRYFSPIGPSGQPKLPPSFLPSFDAGAEHRGCRELAARKLATKSHFERLEELGDPYPLSSFPFSLSLHNLSPPCNLLRVFFIRQGCSTSSKGGLHLIPAVVEGSRELAGISTIP